VAEQWNGKNCLIVHVCPSISPDHVTSPNACPLAKDLTALPLLSDELGFFDLLCSGYELNAFHFYLPGAQR
jgi:hypothetical protein